MTALMMALKQADPWRAGQEAGSFPGFAQAKIWSRVSDFLKRQAGQGVSQLLFKPKPVEQEGELGTQGVKQVARGRGLVSFETDAVNFSDLIGAPTDQAEELERLEEYKRYLKEAIKALPSADRTYLLRVHGAFADDLGVVGVGKTAMARLEETSRSQVDYKLAKIYEALRRHFDKIKRREEAM
jgi:hypothetical protein